MKKIILAMMLAVLTCIGAVFPAYASFENPPITDDADYLTSSQLEELTETLDTIRERYSFDVAVYTEEDMSGADAEECADNIFDYGEYGYGENADGMILYICSNPRVYHFSTHGSGEIFFNDNGLAYLEAKIVPPLKEDDYYSAIKLYAQYSEELLEMAAQEKPYNERQLSMEYICGVIGGAVLLPLLLAYFMMKKKMKKMKTAVKNNYAANYMKQGSMRLNVSRDIFLYSTVTKTQKQKQSSGGHVSSSGEHHGGRGGSY